ncbi:MAG: hypothetical protein U0930_16695 [Pirellulales bacterium]
MYTAFDPEKTNLSDSTKTFLKRLDEQRQNLRNSQGKFREFSEHDVESIDKYSSVINYGYAQSYIDNVVELCSISNSENLRYVKQLLD